MELQQVKRKSKSHTKRIAALRAAIKNGTYVVDPERLAAAMIAKQMLRA